MWEDLSLFKFKNGEARMDTVRYKATIAYDGTDFAGFQIQPNARTVQGEIEKALKIINKNNPVRIHPAGRTDSGVHAKAMVFHFDFPKSIPKEGVFKALNVLTPSDMTLNKLELVTDEYHARYHAVKKTYTFRIDNNQLPNPFTRNFVFHHPYKLDRKRAEEALGYLIGEHDFTSFCSAKTDKEDKVRTIYQASVEVNEETNEWVFTFTGDGFLYHMIRIIMGTLLPIADGRNEPISMKEILEAKDREAGGQTIAPNGLWLEKIFYEMNEFLVK